MAKLTDWITVLQSRVAGPDQNALELELRQAIREFSTQSGAFLKEIGPYAYKAGVSDYRLNPQPTGTVLYVHQVKRADKREITLAQNETAGRTGMEYAYVPEAGIVRLNPVPAETSEKEDGFTVWVGMVPTGLTFSEVPDTFATHWFDHILDGALGRLHSQHKRPWTNMVSAQYHLRRFRNGISQARDVVRRRFSDAEADFVYPPWGNLPRERSRW